MFATRILAAVALLFTFSMAPPTASAAAPAPVPAPQHTYTLYSNNMKAVVTVTDLQDGRVQLDADYYWLIQGYDFPLGGHHGVWFYGGFWYRIKMPLPNTPNVWVYFYPPLDKDWVDVPYGAGLHFAWTGF